MKSENIVPKLEQEPYFYSKLVDHMFYFVRPIKWRALIQIEGTKIKDSNIFLTKRISLEIKNHIM